jgi:hypothetical protein
MPDLRLGIALLALSAQSVQIPIGVPDGPEFVLNVSPEVPLENCHLTSYQAGAFGGHGSLPVRSAGPGRFALRTGLGGKPALELKVAVWCSGYGMALVDVPSLDQSGWARSLTLSPLAHRTIDARVLPTDDGLSLVGSQIRVFYVAYWLCGFFNLPDCMVPSWQVAVGEVGAGDTVHIDVPDFARDPVTGPDAGFKLRADRTEPPYHFWLETPAAPLGVIPASTDLRNLVLRPRRH